jgi:hypothetical protein
MRGVDPTKLKTVRSLYDPPDERNLRDDVRGARARCGARAAIAVELIAPSVDVQLCIREILEDTPSMTAFSTARSALSKEMLLFIVRVGDELTPEVRSRASLVI